ncbi:2-keto-3-deoxy-phosphogluconate aldolase [Stackebrandtia albiflava]|uniref:2-keto-3-deoxy-phosphogluconate aldolase n=1 Tax=Stackebrandtia albiflava TaxID=406432 RepID=A0A562VDR7_9ACTN|nr:bifunctional 4-hydroxy-2-oxoglutarate aldolase/2-dehydro-3-deoxy-phosphogluconate aldolase [Stackebrandtia albiflava]TWJ16024.1 2-keto-3-deoxy-phosphogluconate aldolase [Stackebrandtia albiflava]
MTGFDELFAGHRIMVILRGLPAARTVELATTAWDAGVELVEVPIGEPDQVASLAAAVAAGAERGKTVGAGTVVTEDQVRAAAHAGARYTVAPGLDTTVAAASRAAGLPHLPGVATATEVQRALAAGCDWVKAFPATTLGPAWFKAMHGPFPGLRLVATGGVSVATAPDFLAAGAEVVALGSALSDSRQVAELTALVERHDR